MGKMGIRLRSQAMLLIKMSPFPNTSVGRTIAQRSPEARTMSSVRAFPA